MTDDLVNRLRQLGDRTGLMYVDYDTTIEAANRIDELGAANDKLSCDALQLYARIEKLEAALHEWDALIRHQYTGSREAMSDMQYAAQITAALLHGEAPWLETRIEKLEAALLEIFDHECRTSSKSFIACVARDALWPQALEGKDD